jgi:hypothetical protein
MKYKAGDTVRIRSKEWMDAQEKDVMGCIRISTESGVSIAPMMQRFAGKLAKISDAVNGSYKLYIDNQTFIWTDWMFDPDYLGDGPLGAEEAVRAMLDGETLYDKEGKPRRFTDDEINTFCSLYRLPLRRKRAMTRWEVMDWTNSEASRGWVVRMVYDNDSADEWKSPQWYGYISGIETYQRARLRPDLSGVDEDTIQGFEVEE